jgi:hypothetical protein
MNKRLTRVISLVVLLPVVAVAGYIALSHWSEFRVFEEFYEGATLVMQNISRMETGESEGSIKAGVDEWNRQANKKLSVFYASYNTVRNKEITDSIKYTEALFRDVFALRLNFADTIEPLYSERMQDHQTIRDEQEYEWRMQTLSDISRYITTYADNLNDSIDAFREAIATSNWSDQYREYAWQDWGHGIKPQLVKMLPNLSDAESKIAKYQQFFTYMYKNREVYYVNQNGEFVFSNQRYLNDSLSVLNAMEPQWRKFSVYNPMN